MDAGLYARVSKEEQAQGESASIDQQIAEMRALCQRNGWNVAGVFVDCENYVASQAPNRGRVVNPSGERADRPAFLELLELLKTGRIDAVLCWRDDRLVRHPRVAVALEDALDLGDLRRNGAGSIRILDATGGQIDRFTLSIKAAVWREENKRRTDRARMGKVATLQQGGWPGSYDRLGYTLVKEPGKRGRQIVLVEDEAETVKTVFDWYDAGVPSSEIRRRLLAKRTEQKGTQARHGDWAPSIITSILRAEDYTGHTTWHFEDGTSYTIEIPRIIEPEQFARVQDRVDRNKKLASRNAKGVYLLQGILRCGDCDSGVSCSTIYYTYRRRANGKLERFVTDQPKHTYGCVRAAMFPELGHPRPHHWRGEALDWEVWRWLVDNGIKNPEAIKMQILARQTELQQQGESLDGDIAHARSRLADVEQERAFYQRQAGRGKIDEREFDARMEETEDARRYWQGEISRLLELRDDAQKVQAGLEYVTDLLAVFQAQLPEIDQSPEELRAMSLIQRNAVLEKRRKIVRALCDEVIVWSDGRVKLMGVLDGNEGSEFDSTGPPAAQKYSRGCSRQTAWQIPVTAPAPSPRPSLPSAPPPGLSPDCITRPAIVQERPASASRHVLYS